MAPDLCEYLTRTIRNDYAESQGVRGAEAKIMDQRYFVYLVILVIGEVIRGLL